MESLSLKLFSKGVSKDMISSSLKNALVSTASLGKFDKHIKDQPKRKFNS